MFKSSTRQHHAVRGGAMGACWLQQNLVRVPWAPLCALITNPGTTMPRSMTAYAQATTEAEWGRATWELRGVNNRYLDAVFRLPEELRPLEAGFREQVQNKIKRLVQEQKAVSKPMNEVRPPSGKGATI